MSPTFSLSLANGGSRSIAASFAEANATCILHVEVDDADDRKGQETIVVGCEDGTLYFLQSKKTPGGSLEALTRALETPISPVITSGQRYRRGIASPRSLSPASAKSFSPFQVTKSRVVSSVSAEQAEAPKNYVDFDEEQEKMKNMVKRKGVKDKTVVDSLMPGVERSFPADKCADAMAVSPPSQTESITLASTPLSPSSSTHSLSLPSSPVVLPKVLLPTLADAAAWKLTCHTVPCERARLSSVTSLKTFGKDALILSLHRLGEVGIYSREDGTCLVSSAVEGGVFPLPSGAQALPKLPLIWHWQTLHVSNIRESHLILTCASSEATTSAMQPSESDNDRTEETRVVAFELQVEPVGDPTSLVLSKIGDWSFDGPAESVTLHKDSDGQTYLFHVDGARHLIRQVVSLVDKPTRTESPLPITSSNPNLPLPNPFKALKALRSTENLENEGKEEDPMGVVLSQPNDLGLVPLNVLPVSIRFDHKRDLKSGLLWSEDAVCVIDASGQTLKSLGKVQLHGIVNNARHDDAHITIQFSDRLELHAFDLASSTGSSSDELSVASQLCQSSPLAQDNKSVIIAPGEVISIRKKDGRQRVERHSLSTSISRKTLWKSGRIERESGIYLPRISSILPMELNQLILGYTGGSLEQASITTLIQQRMRASLHRASNISPPSASILSAIVSVERTGERRIIGGADDGSIIIYELNSMQPLARWIVFIEPLSQVIYVPLGRLKGCVLCISRDGTIAIIALDGCQFLSLVPASVAPLISICLGEDNLLLTYSDKRTRLWDVRTREFWRSMSADKATEMMKQGGWTEWAVSAAVQVQGAISTITGLTHALDASSTLLVDLDVLLLSLVTTSVGSSSVSSHGEAKQDAVTKRDYLRALLAPLLTYGLNDDIDRICHETLGTFKQGLVFGLRRSDATTLYCGEGPHSHWTISDDTSAVRAMTIIALLQVLLHYEDKADNIHTISTFYTVSLGQAVGNSYRSPSLALLARIWLCARAPELRTACRQLFEAGVVKLDDDQVGGLVERWQTHLPCLQSEASRDAMASALALFICGAAAIDKYALLSASSLTDIAKSIALYLHDEHSPHRALAIDLCSRGFPVWQQYVDAVEILRALFALATSGRKDTGSQLNIGQQARSAVLLIASGNSPLFMTTVSMDILQPQSVQHRKSVMQLVIFLIHKKPLVLYSNLPRLVEAVVKSLDPNSTANREAVLDSATEILGHLVETYPTLDFHGPTQRLAIGTSEGAVVMYDLKTATRLYVLEGHKRRTTACGFSPDGRRLVTLSLDEHTVLVWKVGSSFTSFFMPGVPPRQGRGGSEPYKTYDFNIGEEGNMSLAATLELVKFDWPSDRSVRIHIRGATLTFST